MQHEMPPGGHRARSEATRAALLRAARRLFVERGYADTATPDVVAAAGVTRGALYHHFADKRDLFRAVLATESRALVDAIEAACPPGLPARRALVAGSVAYLDAMAVPGRTRLLLVDGPAVLGPAEMRALDEAHGLASLRQGLAAAMPGAPLPLAPLAELLSAAFDRAALALAEGADRPAFQTAMVGLLLRVLGDPE
ncbi:MAG: TetR/AcrR family transcriptional regulator [Thalassobaculales bacterium]